MTFCGKPKNSYTYIYVCISCSCAVDKYVSPEEHARRAAAAAEEEEARRRAEADDSRNRALREMMGGTPDTARRGKGSKAALVGASIQQLLPPPAYCICHPRISSVHLLLPPSSPRCPRPPPSAAVW